MFNLLSIMMGVCSTHYILKNLKNLRGLNVENVLKVLKKTAFVHLSSLVHLILWCSLQCHVAPAVNFR